MDVNIGDAVWTTVRERLRTAGVADNAVLLPGDSSAPWEGALVVDSAGEGEWTMASLDYGQRRVLARERSQADLAAGLLGFVLAPLPAPSDMPAAERERLLAWASPHVLDLVGRAAEALAITLPAGLLLDRFGALDGFLLYPSGTSFEARSLPPGVLRQPLQSFVTTGQIEVRAKVTPPWFGRSGGGLRFEITDPGLDIRDLVRSGVLTRI